MKNTLSERYFSTTREEIERLCGYISCDKRIANYFGIEVERVSRVRAERPTFERKRRSVHRRDADAPAIHHTSHEFESLYRVEDASRRLRNATLGAIVRWADYNGTTIDEAAGFLLSGKPLRRAA